MRQSSGVSVKLITDLRRSRGVIWMKILVSLACIALLASVQIACVGSRTAGPGGQGTLELTDTGPLTLDPALAAEAGSVAYIVQIFGGLTRLDENMRVAPDIAASWDNSTDGKTFTFHLRKDAKFHDGKTVAASDFQYSWERALNPATQSITAATYLGDIVGAQDILSGKTVQLSGVKAIDSTTLQVSITSPVPYFLEKMAFPTAFVVDKSNVQSGANWWQRPNGTGPFRLLQWQLDQLVVLERNPAYYGGQASLSRVNFHLFNGNPMDLYQQGNVDVADVSAGYMGLVTDQANSISKELKVFPELSLYYVGFNASTPPFDDAGVRKAFSYAVDKERIISLSLDNVLPAAYGILPPGIPGYNAGLQGLTFDAQKAKDLISRSKYGDVSKLPPLVLTTSGWGNDISPYVGGIIEEWRRNLGVEVTVRQLEPGPFSYSLIQEKNNLYDNGWIADYPDPQDFLDILLHTGSQNNIGGYSNTQLDSLLNQASVEQDTNARYKTYQNAEQLAVQDAALLPIAFGRSYVVVKPYVKGYALSPLGYPLLSKVSVQK